MRPEPVRPRRQGFRRQQAKAAARQRHATCSARASSTTSSPSGPGQWNADVFVASRDMNARGTIEQVGPNRLNVHGCVLAVICKTTHWDRIG